MKNLGTTMMEKNYGHEWLLRDKNLIEKKEDMQHMLVQEMFVYLSSFFGLIVKRGGPAF